MKKSNQRLEKDLILLACYLETTDIIKILRQDKLHENSIKKFFNLIASFIEYKHFENNLTIIKEGDLADSFFVILEGSVTIFSLDERENKLTYEEYFEHLKKLRKLNDIYNLKKTIRMNMKTYPIEVNLIDFIDKILFAIKAKKMIFKNTTIKELKDALKSKDKEVKEFWAEEELKDDNKQLNIETKKKIKRQYTKLFQIYGNFDFDRYIVMNENEKKKVIIYSHLEKLKLFKGNTFGNYALDNKGSLRNATVISNGCHLGVISSDDYDKYIYEEKKRFIRNEIIFFVSNFFFKQFNNDIFEKNFFYFFVEKKSLKNEILFLQNSPNETVYFIKEGEVDLEIKTTLSNLDILIDSLSSNFKGKFKKTEMNNEIKQLVDPYLQKTLTLKVMITQSKQVLGLEEFFKEIPRICSGEVKSHNLQYYEISQHLLKKIIDFNPNVAIDFKRYVNSRLYVLIERLVEIRNSQLARFENIILSKNQNFQHDNQKSGRNLSLITPRPFKTIDYNLKENQVKQKSTIEKNINHNNNSNCRLVLNLKKVATKSELIFYAKPEKSLNKIMKDSYRNLKPVIIKQKESLNSLFITEKQIRKNKSAMNFFRNNKDKLIEINENNDSSGCENKIYVSNRKSLNILNVKMNLNVQQSSRNYKNELNYNQDESPNIKYFPSFSSRYFEGKSSIFETIRKKNIIYKEGKYKKRVYEV